MQIFSHKLHFAWLKITLCWAPLPLLLSTFKTLNSNRSGKKHQWN